MGDQRASWKHKRWYDHYLNTWVDTTPAPYKRDFDLHYKDKRQHIHEVDNVSTISESSIQEDSCSPKYRSDNVLVCQFIEYFAYDE